MRRPAGIAALLLSSVLLYLALFAFALHRPLSLGTLRQTLAEKLAAAEAQRPPRLIILAGSNALFSHSCAVMAAMLRLPCINGGVALGLGLDYQFALWKPVLRPGDILYMPMELQQYAVASGAARTGPDAALMLQRDRGLLLALGPARSLAALFSGTLADALAAMVENAALALHPALARPAFGAMNAQGDGIGHSLASAAADRGFLALLHRPDPSPRLIAGGEGTREIAGFLDWVRAHGLRAIGGFPTEFADAPPDPALAPTLAAIYARHGAAFLDLPNQGRYPRADFFDSQDHLVTECQMKQSILVAEALAPLLGRKAKPPPQSARQLAARCP